MYLARFFALSSLIAMGVVAHADIFIQAGPGNFQGDENILFNESGLTGSGNPVQGVTNNSGFLVSFLSNELLNTPSGGQARVRAQDGAFDFMSISLDDDPMAGYTSLILNINAVANGTVNFTIEQLVGPAFMASFNVVGGGQNFFRIFALNGQIITNSMFTTSVGVSDIRQVRIGGATTNFPPTEAVPEPATMVLGIGAVAAAYMRRRKARLA